ncbi:MAG TPA: hypothetical protein VFF12_07125, partial [Myxococcaceae bacterium]|nr:hypothetical protein [Myxococcaceae bacterium]
MRARSGVRDAPFRAFLASDGDALCVILSLHGCRGRRNLARVSPVLRLLLAAALVSGGSSTAQDAGVTSTASVLVHAGQLLDVKG